MGAAAARFALSRLSPGAEPGLQTPAQAPRGLGSEGPVGLSCAAGGGRGAVAAARRPVPGQRLALLPGPSGVELPGAGIAAAVGGAGLGARRDPAADLERRLRQRGEALHAGPDVCARRYA